jgi:hypothetical protein
MIEGAHLSSDAVKKQWRISSIGIDVHFHCGIKILNDLMESEWIVNMPLTLMYITNNPIVAQIAQRAGVDRIFVDLEYIGKAERQAGMNTVKSHHTIDDINLIKPVLTSSDLLVRVNPLHEATSDYCCSQDEIDKVIQNGADMVMLPMFRTVSDVNKFVEYIDGRAKVTLLLETAEACENIEQIIEAQGIDEVHIGLNDLHLAYKKTFMFELLADGTVQRLCRILAGKGIKYGFGGIARVGYGALPAEFIMTEHYALGSQMAILSRGFCDANIVTNPSTIEAIFVKGIHDIRLKEEEIKQYNKEKYLDIHEQVKKIVANIVENIQNKIT